MSLLLLLTLFSSTSLLTVSAVNCGGAAAPEITYPFHANPHNDSKLRTGFELSCTQNSTVLHFPGYNDLIVKSISYDTRKIDLLDPNSCVHQVFLNLDLSRTPFRYYYVVKSYTYLNCSDRLSPSFDEVSCLSGFGHHVYTAESSSPVPDSCRPIKTVAIPFSFSHYLADNCFGLALTWDVPTCRGLKTKWVTIVLGISSFIVAVAVLVRVAGRKPTKMEKRVEREKLLV